MLERATPVVRSGRAVILDATFSRSANRARAAEWARSLGSTAWLVHADCPADLARERLRRRAERGDDPSEAGPERLEPSRAAFEPPTEWPAERKLEIDTSAPDALTRAVPEAANRIGRPRSRWSAARNAG